MKPIQVDDLQLFIQSIQPKELVVLKNTIELNLITSAIVALSNTNGGSILIGLGKNSKVVGVNPLEIDSIKEYIRDHITPTVHLDFKVIQIRHHFIIQIDLLKTFLILSFRDENQAWKRSLIINHQVHIANEVMEELLKLQTDHDYLENVSHTCCSNIISVLNNENGLSLTSLSNQISVKRSELVFNLAYLIFMKNVRISSEDSKICYFSI